MNLRGQTVFVTGATGFIGGRVCERLVLEKVGPVRALVHSRHKAARIARLPIELVPGDLLDRNSLQSALATAKVVIHCGVGTPGGIVRGTENLLKVAAESGVEKFVHMSTAAVHGLTPPPGTESEDAPVRSSGDKYCDNKARAERVVARFNRDGMSTVIFRPSIVYGPYSAWSTRLVQTLRRQPIALVDGGGGACNTTYVDNLIDAIFLALDNGASSGQTFFLTDGEAITWGDFIRAHAAMLDHCQPLTEVSSEQVRAHYKQRPGMFAGSVKAAAQVLRSRQFRDLLQQIPVTQRILAGTWAWMESLNTDRKQQLRSHFGVRRTPAVAQPTSTLPDEVDFATQTATVFFSIQKARQILGYEPRIPFSHGMALVEQWLRHANYI
jgi:nucleoside-diphosphate-sugar epimerase